MFRDRLAAELRYFARVIIITAAVTVCLLIVWMYRNYFPPRFDRGFLIGRETYFFTSYRWFFYAHILTGPLVLLIGAFQITRASKRRFIRAHRFLGRCYVALTLLVMSPAGLVIAFRAPGGLVAITGLAMLAITTWLTTCLAFLRIRRGDLKSHREWMWRSFLLMLSAVLLRILAAASARWGLDGEEVYGITIWLSWVPSLIIYELSLHFFKHLSRTTEAIS